MPIVEISMVKPPANQDSPSGWYRRRTIPIVGIPKGFPKSVGRVGSRLHGFPCFPYSVISMACFSPGKCWINRHTATQCNVPHSPREDSSLVNERIGDLA